MATAKKKTDANLPYALKRELEEISKNTGISFDLSLPIEALEKICNDANFPQGAWRTRYEGELK